MTPSPLTELRSRDVVLPEAHIDTDQIIPARFLTTTERAGLGRHAFADWRTQADCPLNDERAKGTEVLVAGDNFGCGSSREHAPWALVDLGFRAVISTSFGDIFRQNAHKSGLLTVIVDDAMHRQLSEAPWGQVEIDRPHRQPRGPGESACSFDIDEFSANCLINGTDELAYLLTFQPAIQLFEERTHA